MSAAGRVNAQAKINLALAVHPGVDTKGYHRISTLFQRIDLSDQVTVRLGGRGRSLDVSGSALPRGGIGPAEKNLAYRAADEYLRHARGLGQSFSIELVKHIPVGGGLGGGSADAAGVLRVLDALAPAPMERELFTSIAASLGADVAFLASDLVVAQGSNRGEKLEALVPLPPAEVLLLVPRFGVSTADAYRWLDEDRESGRVPYVERTQVYFGGRSWADLSDSFNDFEPVVERRHPLLRGLRERLADVGARFARLAGSGSTVFGLFDDIPLPRKSLEMDAEEIATHTSARVVEVKVLQ